MTTTTAEMVAAVVPDEAAVARRLILSPGQWFVLGRGPSEWRHLLGQYCFRLRNGRNQMFNVVRASAGLDGRWEATVRTAYGDDVPADERVTAYVRFVLTKPTRPRRAKPPVPAEPEPFTVTMSPTPAPTGSPLTVTFTAPPELVPR